MESEPGAGTSTSEKGGRVTKKTSATLKKKRRRRKRKKDTVVSNNKTDDMIIIHCNVNGYDSKSISLTNIIDTVLPSLNLSPHHINLNEMKMDHERKISLPGFKTFNLIREVLL